MLRTLTKLTAAFGAGALLLTIAGHYVRSIVPEQYHRAGWMTGIVLFCMSLLAAMLVRRVSPAKQRRSDDLMLTGAVIGALLFVLFITDVECSSEPSARGPGVSCRYFGDR